jgi:hypothetical protein
MRSVKHFPFYPLLLSAFSALALLAQNIDQMRSAQAIRAIMVSIIGGGLLLLFLRKIVKDWHRAALIASWLVLLFFSYGHFYNTLKHTSIFNILLGRHRYLFPIWLLLTAIGIYWIIERLQNSARFSSYLNLISAVMLIMPLYGIVSFEVRYRSAQSQIHDQEHEDCDLSYPSDQNSPDIYYIILDAYAREDDLLEVYQYENSTFLENLMDMGFFIADWSQSNYAYTLISLTSSLNINYLDALDERMKDEAPFDRMPILQLLGNSKVRRSLECIGYKTVTIDSGLYATGWLDADVYISSSTTTYLDALELKGGVNAFESMLIHNSAALVLTDAATVLPKFFRIDTDSPFLQHRERMLYIFYALENIVPTIESPKFVFAHILITHWPYIFGPNGEPVDMEGAFTLGDAGATHESVRDAAKYRDQVTFVNSKIYAVIQEILRVSQTPPIIILQSDHGYQDGFEKRLNILNAYLLPRRGTSLLYETISPVNTFRVIFNHYFGGDYPLLEDLSYYSRYATFNFYLVPNQHAEE